MRFVHLCLISVFIYIGLATPSAEAVFPPLPLSIPEKDWRPLYDRVDPVLQAKLETAFIQKRAWNNLLLWKKMAVGIVDLSNPLKPRFARINGRTMMYAASLPKIAILLAAFVSFEDGSLEKTPEIDKELADMIRISSNEAASSLIDRIGFKKIQTVLMDPQYQFYDKKNGGGLWVGKRYAKEGNRVPDPIGGFSHCATVTQVCRFYYLLAIGKIISPECSRQILEILSEPRIHHKFVKELEPNVPRDRIFRKSGTWKTYHCDSVLVWGEVWRRYILVAMVESEEGEQVLRDLVPFVESLLKPKSVSETETLP